MKGVRSSVLIAFFASIAIIGSWHGFPMVDHFADESYFVRAPLLALYSLRFFPQGVPYGTLTYILVIPIQAFVIGVVWIVTSVMNESIEHFLLMRPYIGYIAPRALNIALYIACAIMVLRSERSTGEGSNRSSTSISIALIFLLSTPLLLIYHSGKMWGTSIALLLASGLSLPGHPILSVLFSSLAFANFPIMGVFWITSVFCSCVLCRSSLKKLVTIALIATLVPAAVMGINVSSITLQIFDIINNFIRPNLQSIDSQQTSLALHNVLAAMIAGGKTLVSKTWITSPFAILSLVLLWRARLQHRLRYVYGVVGLCLYAGALTFILSPGYNSGSSFRYLSPIIMLLLIIVSSFRIPHSNFRRRALSALALLSTLTGAIFTLNLALPTTYHHVRSDLVELAQSRDVVIVSSVAAINFPYTAEAAIITKKWMPDRCAMQCTYALKHPEASPTFPTYILVQDPALKDQILSALASRDVVLVDEDVSNALHPGIESGAGNLFQASGWWLIGFGQEVRWTLIEARKK